MQEPHGFTGLTVDLVGDDAWPDLKEAFEAGDIPGGLIERIAFLAKGTTGGKPSVMLLIRFKDDDGEELLLTGETTFALLETAVRAYRARLDAIASGELRA
jgi:hypothetical protein